jgi:hypothetical protein
MVVSASLLIRQCQTEIPYLIRTHWPKEVKRLSLVVRHLSGSGRRVAWNPAAAVG